MTRWFPAARFARGRVGALAVLLLAAGCGAVAPVDGPDTRDAREVARRIGLALPPGARVERAQAIRGMDDAAWLAATMTKAEWDAFRATLPLGPPDRPPFSVEANFRLHGEAAGWDPEATPGLVTAQLPWRGGRESLNVGHAPVDGGRVRVFVFWHQL